jgi:GTPase
MTKNNHNLPLLAIVGKPNVGKSSLFNRLLGKKIAITSDTAGTTRDRIFQKTDINGFPLILVDTGGLETDQKENLEAEMQAQARLAIAEADLVLFVIDGQMEPTQDDVEAAHILRRNSKKLIFVANKCDNPNFSSQLQTWLELGLGEPIAVSVIHNFGFEKLSKEIIEQLKANGFQASAHLHEEKSAADSIKIAVVGRPNAGKSSFVNAVLGQERMIVSDVAGTTRDSVDIDLTYQDQKFTLIDTAGLRRRGKIEKGIEKYSSFRTIKAIEESDIVCLIMDYQIGIRAQDLHISSYILDANKGLILAINKIDLMEDKEAERARISNILRRRFDFLAWAPVVFISAKNKKNLETIFQLAEQIQTERYKEISHEDLMAFLQETFHKHYPPTVANRRLFFYDLKQVGNRPPRFEFLVNKPDMLHFSYQRFLENEFRQRFGFTGTAVQFFYKELDKRLLKTTKAV